MNKKLQCIPGNKVKVNLENSPTMIISGVTPVQMLPHYSIDVVTCIWFTLNGNYQEANFRADLLLSVE